MTDIGTPTQAMRDFFAQAESGKISKQAFVMAFQQMGGFDNPMLFEKVDTQDMAAMAQLYSQGVPFGAMKDMPQFKEEVSAIQKNPKPYRQAAENIKAQRPENIALQQVRGQGAGAMGVLQALFPTAPTIQNLTGPPKGLAETNPGMANQLLAQNAPKIQPNPQQVLGKLRGTVQGAQGESPYYQQGMYQGGLSALQPWFANLTNPDRSYNEQMKGLNLEQVKLGIEVAKKNLTQGQLMQGYGKAMSIDTSTGTVLWSIDIPVAPRTGPGPQPQTKVTPQMINSYIVQLTQAAKGNPLAAKEWEDIQDQAMDTGLTVQAVVGVRLGEMLANPEGFGAGEQGTQGASNEQVQQLVSWAQPQYNTMFKQYKNPTYVLEIVLQDVAKYAEENSIAINQRDLETIGRLLTSGKMEALENPSMDNPITATNW